MFMLAFVWTVRVVLNEVVCDVILLTCFVWQSV